MQLRSIRHTTAVNLGNVTAGVGELTRISIKCWLRTNTALVINRLNFDALRSQGITPPPGSVRSQLRLSMNRGKQRGKSYTTIGKQRRYRDGNWWNMDNREEGEGYISPVTQCHSVYILKRPVEVVDSVQRMVVGGGQYYWGHFRFVRKRNRGFLSVNMWRNFANTLQPSRLFPTM